MKRTRCCYFFCTQAILPQQPYGTLLDYPACYFSSDMVFYSCEEVQITDKTSSPSPTPLMAISLETVSSISCSFGHDRNATIPPFDANTAENPAITATSPNIYRRTPHIFQLLRHQFTPYHVTLHDITPLPNASRSDG